MSASTLQRRYTEAEIEAMATPDLLSLYKQTGDEELKWPLVLRYEGLIKSAALQIRGVYSSFAQVDDIVNEGLLTWPGRWISSTRTRGSNLRPMYPSGFGAR